jgi:hypothetical protein
MRIAVSGTHGVGKSTLIDEFLQRHPEFVHEPEPYTVLLEDLGEEFSAEPCVEDFRRQLEFNIERLRLHATDANVIYERCPVDFFAYIHALDPEAAETLKELVCEGMENLDLIVYLPLEGDGGGIEYPKLQRAVDRRLSSIFREDEFGIMSGAKVIVLEAEGSTEQRLRIIQDAMVAKGRPRRAAPTV